MYVFQESTVPGLQPQGVCLMEQEELCAPCVQYEACDKQNIAITQKGCVSAQLSKRNIVWIKCAK